MPLKLGLLLLLSLGAEKLRVQITVPRHEHRYSSLEERIIEYQGYLDKLNQS